MFHCFTFFLVICFCILRLSLNTPALCPSFHGASPQSGEKPRLCLQEPAHRDHPRVGGEKGLGSQVTQLSQGSPPRRRGKELRLVDHGLQHRITPAWAGKSSQPQSPPSVPEDQPRVGGEKFHPQVRVVFVVGSPPRGRGKGRRVVNHHPLPGITPAWAGKRAFQSPPRTAPQDHPRVGGEKISMSSTVFFWQGSPPRGRGKV